MNGCERQWLLVVLVCLGLLTLFTANGHPFREREAGIGISDDPAESQPLSLSERDTNDAGNFAKFSSDGESGNVTTTTSTNPTTNSTGPGPNNTTRASTVLNIQNLTQNKTSATLTASPQLKVTIIATTTLGTGNILGLTSTRSSSVNIKINSSQAIQNVPKNLSGIKLSTSTSQLKPSVTQHPTGSLSLNVGKSVSSVKSTITPSLASAVLATKVSSKNSVVVSLNPSKSATFFKPTIAASSASKNVVKAISTNSARLQILPSSKVVLASLVSSSVLVKSIVLAVSASQNPTSSYPTSSSVLPSTQGVSGAPSIQNPSGAPSTQNPSGAPSTKGTSAVPSSIGSKVPSTQVSTGATTKPSTQTSPKLPSSKKQTTVPSTGSVSSLPPTTEITLPESTSNAGSSKKPTTEENIQKPSTQASEKPSTKASSAAPSTNGAPATTHKEPTTNVKPKTKEATTKAAIITEKTTADKTKTKNQNNDEGRMPPPPDQGKEAVLWDFIVPVAIGTGVALVIAFGVILVRACRRRRLIKVRFGGKPSHPRLLNNDLINLLAESDDEEE